MKTVFLIGAGNLGSRHLQALKTVKFPLKIIVIDPNQKSLEIAKERYNSMPSENEEHEIEFLKNFPNINDEIEIAIVATNSNIRKVVVEKLLNKFIVKYLILEKLLFQNKNDFSEIQDLLKTKGVKAWVNCPMRMVPFYSKKIKKWFGNQIFEYSISGSEYGLMTNAIHYVDFMVFLAESTDFVVDTKYLDPIPINSKRKGYLELNGILNVHFKNGSHGMLSCFNGGQLPFAGTFTSYSMRCYNRGTEQKALVWNRDGKMEWNEEEAKFPYQSELTKIVVEQLIEAKTCSLTKFEESVVIHLKLLEPIREFLEKNQVKKDCDYPFT